MIEDEEPNKSNENADDNNSLAKLLAMLQDGLKKHQEQDPASLLEKHLPQKLKDQFVKTDEHVRNRVQEIQKTCLLSGCTAVGESPQVFQTDAFNLERALDEHTCCEDEMVTDVCLVAALEKLQFGAESDGEIYSEEQLRPEGIEPSILGRVITIFQECHQAKPVDTPEELKDIDDIHPYLCSGFAVEFFQVMKKHRMQHDHFHYDLKLVCREIIDREEILKSTPFRFQKFRMGDEDFLSSLEFMDENPESGG